MSEFVHINSVLIMQIKNVSVSLYYLQCRKKTARMQTPLSSVCPHINNTGYPQDVTLGSNSQL